MKALILDSIDHMRVGDVPEPATLGDYDALCELQYGAICAGTDHHLLHGRFPWPIRYPTVLGHESVGRVVKVGPKVRHLKIGDIVTRVGMPATDKLNVTWGGFTQLGVARDHKAMQEDNRPPGEWGGYRVNQVVPPGINPAAATMLITWRETFSYTKRLGVTAGSSVLIVGSGGNGLAFAAHARNLGASSIAMVGSANRAGVAGELGVTHYLDYRSENLGGQLEKARPEGFDFLIDAVGKAGEINRSLRAMRPGGTVAIYGIDDYGKPMIDPFQVRKTCVIYNGGYDEAEVHDACIALMQAGKLDAKHWLNLDNPYPLADIADAFKAIADRRAIKAVIKLND